MTSPVVSAVMPNYNDGGTIGEALEALLSQSYNALEIIVVDDASTDNSVEVVERFAKRDSRVQLLRHQKNAGPIVAQLTGFEKVTGEYVFGPSANDKVLPGFVEKVVDCLERHPEAAVGFCDLLCVDDSDQNQVAELENEPSYLAPEAISSILRRRHAFMLGGTALARRSALQEAGWLIPELRWMADFFALHVVAFRYGVCHVPELLYAVRSPLYSGAGPKSAMQRQAILSMLSLLKSPAYADVLPPFNRSGILAAVPGILPTLLNCREHWDLLDPVLCRRALLNEAKNLARPLTPTGLRRAYRQARSVFLK